MSLSFGNLGNFLAFLSVVFYVLTLVPSLARALTRDSLQKNWLKFLTKHRREIGILAWLFGAGHGFYIIWERKLNFFDQKTLVSTISGLSLITIFTLLAITSNQFSVQKLKKNWKRLHWLTYPALFILFWHVYDKMKDQWSIFTPVSLFLIGISAVLVVLRFGLNHFKKPKKTKTPIQKPAQEIQNSKFKIENEADLRRDSGISKDHQEIESQVQKETIVEPLTDPSQPVESLTSNPDLDTSPQASRINDLQKLEESTKSKPKASIKSEEEKEELLEDLNLYF